MPESRKILLPSGINCHFLEWDKAHSTHTLLLIHGFLDFAWGWLPLMEASALADNFHVVAVDLRGHGDTDWVSHGGYYHFSEYLADIHDIIAVTARSTLSIVGHSMGGVVASYYTGTYPERIQRLALLEGNGPPEMGATGPERTRGWIEAHARLRQTPAKTYASVAEAAARMRHYDPLISDEMARLFATHGTRQLADGRVTFKHDPRLATPSPYAFRIDIAQNYWRNISCPVLLVDGGDSIFRMGETEEARREGSYAHATKTVIPGAGHMLQRHQPAALGQVLLDFFSPAAGNK